MGFTSLGEGEKDLKQEISHHRLDVIVELHTSKFSLIGNLIVLILLPFFLCNIEKYPGEKVVLFCLI